MYKNKINKIDISDPYWPFLTSHKIVWQQLGLASCPVPSAVFHRGAGSAEPGSSGFVLSALALCQLHHSQGQAAEIRVFRPEVVDCGIPLIPLRTTSSMPRSPSEPVPALALSCAQVPLLLSRALQGTRYRAVTLYRVFYQKKPVPSWDPRHGYHCFLG